MTVVWFSLVGAVFLGALGTTWAVRELARRKDLVDRPNHRSAHDTPTPRLGGVGIVVPFLVGASLVAWVTGKGPAPAVLAATGAIAVLGLVDDLRPLPARWRFGVQVAAAVAVVVSRHERLGSAMAPFDTLLPSPVLGAAAVLWMVWATNLYNFMDGIDGLAGGQAVWASLGLACAAFSLGDHATAWALIALAAASAGFLRFNLPKASIFMGDVGSTAIGFFLATLPFASEGRPIPVAAVVLALSLFVLDATTTLVRRVARGEKWHAPHRTHLYQRPLGHGIPHQAITYRAYAGMALVAGMAALYPTTSARGRVLMFVIAIVLFGGAWLLVRALEHGRTPGRART